MFRSPPIDPLARCDFRLLRDGPPRVFSVTVKPNQDLPVDLTAGPAAHFGKLRHWMTDETKLCLWTVHFLHWWVSGFTAVHPCKWTSTNAGRLTFGKGTLMNPKSVYEVIIFFPEEWNLQCYTKNISISCATTLNKMLVLNIRYVTGEPVAPPWGQFVFDWLQDISILFVPLFISQALDFLSFLETVAVKLFFSVLQP